MATLAGRTTARFALVGVTWPRQSGDEAVTAQVRVRVDGRWTGWQRLTRRPRPQPGPGQASAARAPSHSGSAPPTASRPGSSPRRYAVARCEALPGRPGHVRQDAPAALDRQASAARTTAAAPAPYPQPAIVTRAGWGADESLRVDNPGCRVPSYTPTGRSRSCTTRPGRTATPPASRPAWCAPSTPSTCRAGLVRPRLQLPGRQVRPGLRGPVRRRARAGARRAHRRAQPVLVRRLADGRLPDRQPSAASMESTARVIAWKLDGHYRNPSGTTTLVGKRFNVVSGHRDARPPSARATGCTRGCRGCARGCSP